MRKRYRMFLRGEVFWIQDNETRKQETLRTKDRLTAERLFNARNEAHVQPVINLQIARAYLMVWPISVREVVADGVDAIAEELLISGGNLPDYATIGKLLCDELESMPWRGRRPLRLD